MLLIAVIFFLNFTGRVILAPLLPIVEADLGITHAQAGMFFLFLSAGYLTAMSGAGYVSARLTHHRTIVLSFALLGLSTLGAAGASTLAGMRLGVFTMGLGAGLYLPSAIATITSLVTRPHWGKAISIHELAPNTSFVAVPLLAQFPASKPVVAFHPLPFRDRHLPGRRALRRPRPRRQVCRRASRPGRHPAIS